MSVYKDKKEWRKWNEMVLNSLNAIEDFRDFADDVAIVRADKKIQSLRSKKFNLERQLAEAREFKCPKCKEVLTPYIDEDEFYGDRLSWFCACEPRDLPIIENQLKEKEQ